MSDTDNSIPAYAAEAADTSPEPSSAPVSKTAGHAGKRSRAVVGLWLVLLVLAAVLGAALYYQYQQYQAVRADLARLQDANSDLAQNARTQAAQALDMVRAQSERLAQLESTIEATSSQIQDLDQALQLMTDSGSDLLLLNDIDHLVTIAQQQLALGGKVANAIISLEAAQAQLARANRPSLAALQQSINGDLDRLRAVSLVDVSLLSSQLDELSILLETAPLLVPDKAPGVAADDQASGQTEQLPPLTGFGSGGWRSAVADSWQWTKNLAGMMATDFRGLFDIRRVDDSAALLMSPEQAYSFRESLKQRAVMAQMALMMHQSRIWTTELSTLAQAIDQRYDMRDELSRKALKLARDLLDSPVETRLPGVENSLSAIAAARDDAANKNEVEQAGKPDSPDHGNADETITLTPADQQANADS